MWRLACALAALCVLVPAAMAGDDEQATTSEVWSVAGRVVLRLRGTLGEMTPRRRVEVMDERLTEILSKVERPITVSDIELHTGKGAPTITVCGDLLVTVLPGDAEPNRMTPEKLGAAWLSNIRKTVPLLSPRVNRGGV